MQTMWKTDDILVIKDHSDCLQFSTHHTILDKCESSYFFYLPNDPL